MYKLKSLVTFLLLASAFTILSSSSCKKDDNNDTPAETKTQLLTKADWKIVKVELRTNPAAAYSDATSLLNPCEKDNIQLYRTNGTFELNEGATRCSPSDPQVISAGNWVFLNSETQLKMTETGASVSDTATIDQLSATSLILSGKEDISGTIYFSRLTFGH